MSETLVHSATERPTERSVVHLAITIMVVAALFSGLIWANIQEARYKQLPLAGAMALAADGVGQELPVEVRDRVRSAVAQQPVDQALLNLIFADALRRDPKSVDVARLRPLLAALGWRSTPAQQNLITDALQRSDLETIIDRADGLLRRERLGDQILTLLLAVEAVPQVQDLLVRAIERDPNWRAAFFTRSDLLVTDAQFAGRARTLEALLDAKVELPRGEMAASINALARHGDMENAYRVFARYRPDYVSKRLLSDPDFSQTAAQDRKASLTAVPFEWALARGRGIQSTVTGSAAGAELSLRWDGRGRPLLLSQTIKGQAGAQYMLDLHGVDADLALDRTLLFQLRCPDEAPIRFVDPQPREEGKVLQLTSEGPATCAYPRFEVQGRLQDIDRPQDVRLSRIEMTKY